MYTYIFPVHPLTQNNQKHDKGEDLERNDGSAARPYYMSPSLREILWKNKEEDPSEPNAQQQQQHDEDSQLKQEAHEENAA